jgi:hypothetical protein
LLDWLNAAKEGKSTIQSLKDEVAAADGQGGTKEIKARAKLARELCQTEDFSAATEQYLWLWEHGAGNDGSLLLVPYMSMVAQSYPPAKKSFSELRDQAENTNRLDWLTLNAVVGQDNKTLDWFDQVKTSNSPTPPWQGGESKLERVLVTNGRWADIAIIYKDPLAALKADHDKEEALKGIVKRDVFPYRAGALYAAFLAAGNDAVAEKIAADSLQLDDTPQTRKALVSCALSAHQPRPCQLLWSFEALDFSTKVAAIIISVIGLVIAGGATVAGVRALIARVASKQS